MFEPEYLMEKQRQEPWYNSVIANFPTLIRMWVWIITSWAIVGGLHTQSGLSDLGAKKCR